MAVGAVIGMVTCAVSPHPRLAVVKGGALKPVRETVIDTGARLLSTPNRNSGTEKVPSAAVTTLATSLTPTAVDATRTATAPRPLPSSAFVTLPWMAAVHCLTSTAGGATTAAPGPMGPAWMVRLQYRCRAGGVTEPLTVMAPLRGALSVPRWIPVRPVESTKVYSPAAFDWAVATFVIVAVAPWTGTAGESGTTVVPSAASTPSITVPVSVAGVTLSMAMSTVVVRPHTRTPVALAFQ